MESGTPTLPANVEAEQGLIGAILINSIAYGKVSEFLAPEHFSVPVHQRIFSAIGKLIERGQIPDPIMLKNLFDQDGALIDIGGAAYLAQLARSAVTIINSEFYGRAILECWQRRELIAQGQDIVSRAFRYDQDDQVEKQIADADERLVDLTIASTSRHAVSLADAADQSLETTQAAYRDPRDHAGVSSGIVALDRIVGGFIGGNFIVLGGRPGQGKSALLNSVAWAALLNTVPVHIFSGEMKAAELSSRLMAAMSGVSASTQRRGNMTAGQFSDLMAARDALQGWPCLIDDRPMTLGHIRQQARAVKRRQKTGLIFIDNLQLVRIGSDDEANRNFEVGRVSNALKALAMDLDVPIIALSHLSRDLERRDDKRPMMADLRNAGEIEQDADVVMLLYRHEFYLEKAEPVPREREGDQDFGARWGKWKNALESSRGKAEIICAKVRHDSTGTANVLFDGARSFFHDSSQDDQTSLIDRFGS